MIVRYEKQAVKALRKIDTPTRKRIVAAIDLLGETGQGDIKKLRGEKNLFRLRVGGWRVIYNEDGIVLLVLKIKPRGGAY